MNFKSQHATHQLTSCSWSILVKIISLSHSVTVLPLLGRHTFKVTLQQSLSPLVQFSSLIWTLCALIHCIFHLFCNLKKPLSYSCPIEVLVLNLYLPQDSYSVLAVCSSLSFCFPTSSVLNLSQTNFSPLCSSFCASCCPVAHDILEWSKTWRADSGQACESFASDRSQT